jgi:hypothetical protein
MTKIVKKNAKVKVEKCPHCKDELLVQTDGTTEVFVCENCKFKIKKKKR